MADKKTNIPPVTKATSVAVAPTDGLQTAANLPAHCEPCPPTIRLDAPLRWKGANSKEQKLLRNLQGNILKGHGRDHSWNVFFTFGANTRASRRLLRQLGNGFVQGLEQFGGDGRYARERDQRGAMGGAYDVGRGTKLLDEAGGQIRRTPGVVDQIGEVELVLDLGPGVDGRSGRSPRRTIDAG